MLNAYRSSLDPLISITGSVVLRLDDGEQSGDDSLLQHICKQEADRQDIRLRLSRIYPSTQDSNSICCLLRAKIVCLLPLLQFPPLLSPIAAAAFHFSSCLIFSSVRLPVSLSLSASLCSPLSLHVRLDVSGSMARWIELAGWQKTQLAERKTK